MLLAASVLLSCAQLEESRCERLAAVVSHAQSQSALLPRSALPFSLVSHPAEARSLLSAHDAFVFDCDGVLWSGSLGLLPGVADLLEHLERLGKRSIFVTNNSAKSRAQYAEKFRALGLRVDPEQIVPASYAAARWLRSARPSLQAAFVIGEQGVDDELRAVGIEPIHLPRSRPPFDESAFANARADPRVGAVVVGADHSFDFGALAIASLYLESPEVLFVATNTDAFDIVGKRRLPGNGCLVAAVQMATSRKPDAVTGKPSDDLAAYLLEAYGLDPQRTLVVGDRTDTDVALAHAMGCASLLVLTGVATAEHAARQHTGTPGCPTYVVSHLGLLVEGTPGS